MRRGAVVAVGAAGVEVRVGISTVALRASLPALLAKTR